MTDQSELISGPLNPFHMVGLPDPVTGLSIDSMRGTEHHIANFEAKQAELTGEPQTDAPGVYKVEPYREHFSMEKSADKDEFYRPDADVIRDPSPTNPSPVATSTTAQPNPPFIGTPNTPDGNNPSTDTPRGDNPNWTPPNA